MLLITLTVFILLLIYYLCLKPLVFWRLNRKVFTIFLNYSLFQTYFTWNHSFFRAFLNIYQKYVGRHRYIGTFLGLRPALYLIDHNLIQQVLISDFSHFTDRVNMLNDEVDTIVGNSLFELKGQKWRDMRSKFSPAFTGNKMRNMHKLMQQVAKQFTNKLAQSEEDEVEISTMFNKYLIDIMANCAFGEEINSFLNQNNIFHKIGNEVHNPTWWTVAKGVIFNIIPPLAIFFRLYVIPQSISQFFHQFVKDAMAYREKNNIHRPDFIHLMMKTRKACVKDDDKTDSNNQTMEISDKEVTGQFVVFFVAGIVTSSTQLTAVMYELATNPQIQSKLQAEIDKVRSECGENAIPHDYLVKMKYLDQVLNETLRKWPAAYALNRECTRDYRIEAKLPQESDLIVEKGWLINIPVIGLHYNPDFYPNPEQFDPERFSAENAANLVPGTYWPFGGGPRICIAQRFAMLVMKTIVVAILEEYTVKPAVVRETKLRIANRFTTDFKDPLWVRLEKRHK